MEQSSVGFQTRIYFKAETPEVKIFPILRVQYDQSLPTKLHNLSSTSVFSIYDNFDITAKGLQPFQRLRELVKVRERKATPTWLLVYLEDMWLPYPKVCMP